MGPDAEILLADEAATKALGASLVGKLGAGDVVLLHGPLGAGKTTLVRGYLEAAGFSEPVRSPTFNLLQVFETQPPVLHADLYRVTDLKGLDLEDYLGSHVLFVEWPENGGSSLSEVKSLEIRIEMSAIGRKATISRQLG